MSEKPYDTSKTAEGGQRQVYKPKDVANAQQATFHLLHFAKDGVLDEWSTTTFASTEAQGTLDFSLCCSTFVCLGVRFPGVPPKPQLLRIMIFDLQEGKARNYSIDVEIEGKQQIVASTGEIRDTSEQRAASYLYLLIANRIHVYSLQSGKQVVGVLDPGNGFEFTQIVSVNGFLVLSGPNVPFLYL